MSIQLIRLKQINSGELGAFLLTVSSGNVSGLLQPYFASSGFLGDYVLYSKTNVAQTVLGPVSFASNINVPYSGGSGSPISKNFFLDSINNLSVTLGNNFISSTGNVTVSGIKTFLSSPVIPNPINSGDAASKRYVDNAITLSGSNTGLYNTLYISKTGDQQASGILRFVGSLMLTGTPAGGGASSLIFRDNLENAATETLELYPFADWVSLDSRNNSTNALWLNPTTTFIEDETPSAGICFTSGILYSGITRVINLNWKGKLLNGQWAAGTGFNISGQFAQTGIIAGTGINVINNNNGTYTVNNTSTISVTGSSGITLTNIIATGGTSATLSGASTVLIGSERQYNLSSFHFTTGITSGLNFQQFPFPAAFASIPIVFGNINNNVYNDMISYQLSGVSTTGFSMVFSAPIPFTGYQFMGQAITGQNGYYNLRHA